MNNLVSRIAIEGFKINAYIGVYEWEHRIKQPLHIHVQLTAKNTPKHIVDYASVVRCMRVFIENQKYRLLEDLAQELIAKLTEEFAIASLDLKMQKPDAMADVDVVGIEMHWQDAMLSPPDEAVSNSHRGGWQASARLSE